MTHLNRALSHVHSLDELARNDSPLGRLDARAKVLSTLAFLVVVASFDRHDLSRPLPLLIWLAAGVALGDVPPSLLVSRLAIASPFAIVVGIANPWLETEPWLSFDSFTLSWGWASLLSIVERFLLSLTAVLLLVGTTGLDRVASALGRLGMPRVFVTQLLLLYRYGFVLAAQVGRMLRAHALRAPEHPRPTLRTVRSLLGELLLRSLARAERIHVAMLCRGFEGEIRYPDESRFGVRDLLFLATSVAYLVWVRAVDLTQWLARLVQ